MTDSWFHIDQLGDGFFRIREPGYTVDSYCYLIEGSQKTAVIDTGHGFADLRTFVENLSNRPPVVLLTHAHADHAGGAHQFPHIYAHRAAAATVATGWSHDDLAYALSNFFAGRILPDDVTLDQLEIPGASNVQLLAEGDVIDLGDRQLDVFETPGHSDGDLSFLDLEHRLLFTGDALYSGNIAISDTVAYRKSIEKLNKLATLADAVYGAHGTRPLDLREVEKIRRAFYVAMGDRGPDRFLGDLAAYEFDNFGFLLPPRRRREN